jgi:hypothetical protein
MGLHQTLKRNSTTSPSLHDVVLALHAGLAGGAGGLRRPGRHEVVEGDDLRLDEAALEVAVDDAGGLGRRGALLDRPGAGLLRPAVR